MLLGRESYAHMCHGSITRCSYEFKCDITCQFCDVVICPCTPVARPQQLALQLECA
jgi:hypothetical protein